MGKISGFIQKLLLGVLVFVAIFMVLALILRITMHYTYLPWVVTKENLSSIFRLYQYGFAYDLRIVTSALILPFVLGYLCSLFELGRKYFFNFFAVFMGICGSLFTLFYILNYFYFQIYQTQIDIFIFGLADDNTGAILKIAFEDYPVIWGIFLTLLVGVLCFWIARKLPQPKFHTSPLSLFVFNLVFLFLFVAGVRGSFLGEPLLRAQSNVSSLKLINHLVPNPIMAFAWAISDYQLASDFYPVSEQEGEDLIKKAQIQAFSRTGKNVFLEQNPPHVVLNLMESFGSNLLSFDDEKTFDLLGSLRKHFKSDFVFERFLPTGNGTAPSFSALFFNSPNPKIGLTQVKNKILEGNPFLLYAQKGYEVIFITAGNASWFGYGDYMQTQGVHKVYDANALIDIFPEAKQYRTAYGIPDEYAYQLLEKLLSQSQKPLFVCILTISNHPPEIVPAHYRPYPLQKDLSSVLPKQKAELIPLAYQYANDAFGRFVDFVKNSSLREKTIIGATGDHKMRSLSSLGGEQVLLDFAVPLYLYIPQTYLKAVKYVYDPLTLGSHKDIFPTLLEFSLSNVEYFSNGGENMLKSAKNRFAYNEAMFANDLGILTGGENYFPWGAGTKNLTQPVQAPQEMLERSQSYREFQWWQIRARTQGN